MQWSTILHKLQQKAVLSVRHFGLLLIAVNTLWLGLSALPAHATYQEEWQDPYNLTSWIYGDPYKSVIHSMPQVVDVGQGFVEYNIERVKSNDFWVDCPTSSFHIKTANTEVWAVNRTEQVLSKCIWQLWAFNGSAWTEIEDSTSTFTLSETDTSASLEHHRVMEDSSQCNVTWTFNNRAKASVTFRAGQSRAYAITWHVECPRATREEEQTKTLTLHDKSEWLCLLDYYDARMWHNQTEVSALGQTGRKARLTFANMTMQTGEQLTIDPTVDTFQSEASRDGYIQYEKSTYPPDPPAINNTSTNSPTIAVGQVNATGLYLVKRGFLSFNTSTVNQTATIERGVLYVYNHVQLNDNGVFYNIKVYEGYYGTNLTWEDWETCTDYEGILTTSSQPTGWQTLIISASAINSTGLTQFKLISSRDENEQAPADGMEQAGFRSANSENYEPYLEVYYEQAEEDGQTKGEGTEDGTTTGGSRDSIPQIIEDVGVAVRETGLYWLAGSLIVITVAGVYAGTKTKRVSRTAKGKTGGGGSHKPTGTPKKRSRDARGRFK